MEAVEVDHILEDNVKLEEGEYAETLSDRTTRELSTTLARWRHAGN